MVTAKRIWIHVITTILILGVSGCNKDDDPGIPQSMDLYVNKGKQVVIDLAGSFPDFEKMALLPDKVSVSFMAGRYLRYQSSGPDPDSFSFTVLTKTQRIKVSVNVITTGNDACGQAFTYAKIKKNTKFVINLFNNPEFCTFNLSAATGTANMTATSTDTTLNTDGLNLFTCGCGTTAAVLSYNPPKEFVGQVKSKYYFGIPKEGAKITIEDFSNPTPAKWEAFSSHDFVIDVVE